MIVDALSNISKARELLAEARTIQDCRKLIGVADVARVYFRQSRASKEVIVEAIELRVRAERLLGEILKTTPMDKGGRPQKKPVGKLDQFPDELVQLKDVGITKDESSRAQQLASIPEDEFEEVIATARDEGDLSIARVLKSAKSKQRRGARAASGDFFRTPSYCVRRFLEACELPGGRWLEPCVGDGSIVNAVNEYRSDVEWTRVDIRPECDADLTADYLDLDIESEEYFDVILTNPPYTRAMEFVQASLVRADVVVMLLRLNWLGSEDRAPWLQYHMPSDIYVLPNRPDFTGEGGDATEYMWAVWREDLNRRHAKVWILDTTPVEERRRGGR